MTSDLITMMPVSKPAGTRPTRRDYQEMNKVQPALVCLLSLVPCLSSRAPHSSLSGPMRFLAGSLSGTITTLAIYPAEVIKTRLAASQSA